MSEAARYLNRSFSLFKHLELQISDARGKESKEDTVVVDKLFLFLSFNKAGVLDLTLTDGDHFWTFKEHIQKLQPTKLVMDKQGYAKTLCQALSVQDETGQSFSYVFKQNPLMPASRTLEVWFHDDVLPELLSMRRNTTRTPERKARKELAARIDFSPAAPSYAGLPPRFLPRPDAYAPRRSPGASGSGSGSSGAASASANQGEVVRLLTLLHEQFLFLTMKHKKLKEADKERVQEMEKLKEESKQMHKALAEMRARLTAKDTEIKQLSLRISQSMQCALLCCCPVLVVFGVVYYRIVQVR